MLLSKTVIAGEVAKISHTAEIRTRYLPLQKVVVATPLLTFLFQ